MEFDPRRPREGINVSEEHPLIEAGTLIIGLSLIFAVVAISLIFMVEIALYFVPEDKEAAMFENWLPEDIATVSPDDERLEKLESIIWRLARHYPESPYTFRIEIDDSEYMNAMALPGGLIILTSGLLDKIETENELAFILGHEMGHFRNRDHIRALGRGVVISVMFAAISGSGAGTNLGASITDLALRGFSRGQETDADEFGLEIVHQEYGHVADSWRFFERIDEENGDDDDSIELLTYLSTHPSPDDRVTDLINQAGKNGWSISGEVTPVGW
jgi:Zn-dependent protease with chaperone function